MNKYLLLLLLFTASFTSKAQDSISGIDPVTSTPFTFVLNDSLIQELLKYPTVIETPISFPIWPPDPIILETVFFIDQCGDSYYENGNLYARCECNDKGVLDGKAVFWRRDGSIESVKYYSNGQVYTERIYSRYSLNSPEELRNYTYKNGEMLLHGKHIIFHSVGRTESNYYYGVKKGWEITYENGIVKRRTLYENDHRLIDREFNEKGILISESTWDKNYQPVGKWFTMDLDKNIRTETDYENAKKKYFKRFVNDLVIEEEHYDSDRGLVYRNNKFQNGSRKYLFYIDSTQTRITKEWSKDGELISYWRIRDFKLIDSGFYTKNNQKITYEQVFTSDGEDHLECWTITEGDTTSFYYARNQGGGFNTVIAENFFVQKNGRAVKHGEWTTYEDNQLVSQLNYDNGELHGRCQWFKTVQGEQLPYISGHFDHGQQFDLWSYHEDSLNIQAFFTNSGFCNRISVYEKGIASEEFRFNEEQEGRYTMRIFKNGELLFYGLYVDNKRSGEWREYHPTGNTKGYGFFENGVPTSKWVELVPKPNGKMKKVKSKNKEIPDLEIPDLSQFHKDVLL